MWLENKNISESEWDKIVKKNKGDFKQSYNWGEYKKVFSWNIIRLLYQKNGDTSSAVQILYKKKSKFVIMFIPGGIVNDCKIKNAKLLQKIYSLFKDHFVYIRLHSNTCFSNSYYDSLMQNNWVIPSFLKSPSNLICIKKLSSKIELLNSYKQKWRYNLKRIDKEKFNITISQKINVDETLKLAENHEVQKKSNINYKHDKNHFSYLDQYFPNRIVNIQAFNQSNHLISCRILILFNNCAWNYLNLTSDEASKYKCNYLMLHKSAEFLIDKKIEEINLGELNLRDFPGVYQFKTGFEKQENKIIGELTHSNNKFLAMAIEIFLKKKFKLKKNIYDFIFSKLKI